MSRRAPTISAHALLSDERHVWAPLRHITTMDDPDPGRALRRSARDHEAFAEFYKHSFTPILTYIARRVHDSEVAVDLTSETFAQAFLHRRRFRGSSTPEAEAWIYRIAERQISRYFRTGKAELRAIGRLQIQQPVVDAARRAAIEELADVEGLRSELRAGLSRISPAQKEAVGLRVLEGLSYAEVADRLQITEQAARARVSRALKALATSMRDHRSMKETA